MFIAMITAAVLLMTGFVFADTLTDQNGEVLEPEYRNDRFFGHMRGFGWSDEAREDWDRDEEGLEGYGNDGFFGSMRGYGWSDEDRTDWDRDEYPEEGYGFGRFDHCYFEDEDREDMDFEAFREEWLTERFEVIDEGVKAGEITEEEATEYKEFLEERSSELEEEGSFQRGPGMGRGMGRGRGGNW